MIQYFNSRDLSEKLDINLARWKRWSREFLPPDPLGGKQTGYARQYSLADAFLVYLGGHLVGILNLSIPEAKNVIMAFGGWMTERKLFPGIGNDGEYPEIQGLCPGAVGLVILCGFNKRNSFFIQESTSPDFFNPGFSQMENSPLSILNVTEKPSPFEKSHGQVIAEKAEATSAKIVFLHTLVHEFKTRLNLSLP